MPATATNTSPKTRLQFHDVLHACSTRQAELQQHAGIPDIEVVDPAVPGFAQRAAFLLSRDGVRCTLQPIALRSAVPVPPS